VNAIVVSQPVRYRIRSSDRIGVLSSRTGDAGPDGRPPLQLELVLPPYCGQGRLYLGRAVTIKRAKFAVAVSPMKDLEGLFTCFGLLSIGLVFVWACVLTTRFESIWMPDSGCRSPSRPGTLRQETSGAFPCPSRGMTKAEGQPTAETPYGVPEDLQAAGFLI